YGLVAVVRNIGQAALPPNVVVGYYAGSPPNGVKLGERATVKTLFPAQSEKVFLPLPDADSAITSGETLVYAVVDDTTVPHPSWQECRTDNNVSNAVSGKCLVIP